MNTHAPLRIAIVDDHKLILDALRVWLQNHTTDLEVVISTSTWAELMANPDFPVDVVLLDIDLKDNIPLPTKVGAIRNANTGVALMSSLTDAETIRDAFAAGAGSFVSKSEAIDVIVTGVRAAASGEPFISEEGRKHLERHIPATTPGLTERERKVVAMYAEGIPMKEIAGELKVSEETVRTHVRNVRVKYNSVGVDVSTQVKLRIQARKDKIIPPVGQPA